MAVYGICDSLTDMWAIVNAVDSATLTGTSATTELGVANLKDPRVGKVWRTATGGSSVLISFAAAVPLQMFGVFALNPYNTALTLRIGTTVGGSEVRSGAWNPPRSNLTRQCFWLNAEENGPQTAAPLVVEIELGIAASNVDVGRIWASDYTWTPEVSHSVGSDQSLIDMSSVQRTRRSGAVLADVARRQRLHSVKYDIIPQDQWDDEVYTLSYYAGLSRQLLFVPNYLIYPPVRHAILGYNEQINPIAALGFDRFARQFNLRESG